MPLHEESPIAVPKYIYRDGSRYLEARDVLSDAESKKQKAGYQPGTSVLEVRITATHSGMLINGRSYPGKRQRVAARTWVDPHEKPLLTHHQSGKGFGDAVDPIGRVKKGLYHQTAQGDAWENDHKHPLPMGSGFIELVVHVTDPLAIEKVLDGRYKTVSQGFDTDGMYCSVCDADWYKGDGCEHRPGRPVEDKKGKKGPVAHFYTGALRYDEISFVNVPADPYAFWTSAEFLKDARADYLKGEVEDPRTAPVLFDALVLDGKTYEVTKPEDREIVEVTLCHDCGSKVRDAAPQSGPKVVLQVVSGGVVQIGAMGSTGAPTSQDTATQNSRSEDPSMSSTTETKESPKAPEPTPAPVDASAKLAKELADAKAELAAKDAALKAAADEAKALREETTRLAAEVQKNQARRLLDLRMKAGDPTVAAATDAAKYEELVVDYAKRSRASLEDAIKDAELLLAALPAPKPPEAPKEIKRGSVSPEDAGVRVDTSKDEPKTDDSKGPKVPEPAAYKGSLAGRFKTISEKRS